MEKRVRRTLKKYFVPHEENDHKPHLLRPRTVTFVLVIALVMESLFIFGASYLAPNSKLFGIIFTNVLVDETNQSRAANDVPQLVVSPLLQAAAQDKANDMVANNYFAHTSPSGVTPWDWFAKVGYEFEYAGENLAVNFSDSQDVTNAWMNSPEHRANILNADFTQIGIATATGTYEGTPAVYVVEDFGTPIPPAPPAEPLPFISSAGASANPVPTAAPKIPKVVVAKSIPRVIASSSLQTATSNQTFVAIQGAETTTATSTTSGTVLTVGAIGMVTPQPQSNPIQKAAANPRQLIDDIYFAIIILFALALGINAIVKAPVRHKHIIFGGMLVILVVGLLIVFNQHMLVGTAIL